MKMTPTEAWEFAASWGSTASANGYGACMYNFDESCRPASEEHRQEVIEYAKDCRHVVKAWPENFASDELDKIDAFIEFITNRELAP